MVDLRAELGTGESLRPLASDLARDEEEERREAEQGGSTVREPRLAPTPPTLGPILHSECGRCVGETTSTGAFISSGHLTS